MGAVKKSRWFLFENRYTGEEYWVPKSRLERVEKKHRKLHQQNGRPYLELEFNNKRKMAGLPMRRIHRH
mgnify:CR=1 FL=1